jgi:vitamin K-dependent gamma-carboxylase
VEEPVLSPPRQPARKRRLGKKTLPPPQPVVPGVWERWRRLLAERVDGASLALFRICFGLVIAGLAIEHLWPRAEGSLVGQFYVQPEWFFPYHGFEWVRPWPEPLMSLEFAALGVAGLLAAAGLYYRPAAVAVAVLFGHIFLLDESQHHNHYYLILLLACLFAVMPAATLFSVDRWRARRSGAAPPDDTVPFWMVLVLRAQIFLLYFYAGVHKLHPDWLSGQAMWVPGAQLHALLESWLGTDALAALGRLGTAKNLAQAIAISGLAFDVAIGFLLIARRTRYLGLTLAALFHLINGLSFDIGFLPVLAFSATLIFCEPDWPRRFARWLRRPAMARPEAGWLLGGTLLVPVAGLALGWKARPSAGPAGEAPRPLSQWAAALLAGWLLFQGAWPARHWIIPGDAQWTDEGQRFSWRMMLRGKRSHLAFRVEDPGLLVAGTIGAPGIDRQQWERRFPHVVHVDVDALAIDWSDAPELIVLFEPHVGERIVFNPSGAGVPTLDAAHLQLTGEWRAKYGREPQLAPTVSLDEALEEIERALRPGSPGLADLAVTRRRMVERPRAPAADDPRLIALWDVLDQLLGDPEAAPIVHQALARTHPFALAGRNDTRLSFLSVIDPQVESLNERHRSVLDRQAWRGTDLVYLDITRVRHEGWRNLPLALLVYEGDRLSVEWNYHADLAPFQIRAMQGYPCMIHQYAGRIVQRWEELFGRRPRVYAARSDTALNHHPPQPLIDPTVDLAAAPIDLFWHNPWILPSPAAADSTAERSAADDRDER